LVDPLSIHKILAPVCDPYTTPFRRRGVRILADASVQLFLGKDEQRRMYAGLVSRTHAYHRVVRPPGNAWSQHQRNRPPLLRHLVLRVAYARAVTQLACSQHLSLTRGV
jgi:hypothetical protein